MGSLMLMELGLSPWEMTRKWMCGMFNLGLCSRRGNIVAMYIILCSTWISTGPQRRSLQQSLLEVLSMMNITRKAAVTLSEEWILWEVWGFRRVISYKHSLQLELKMRKQTIHHTGLLCMRTSLEICTSLHYPTCQSKLCCWDMFLQSRTW